MACDFSQFREGLDITVRSLNDLKHMTLCACADGTVNKHVQSLSSVRILDTQNIFGFSIQMEKHVNLSKETLEGKHKDRKRPNKNQSPIFDSFRFYLSFTLSLSKLRLRLFQPRIVIHTFAVQFHSSKALPEINRVQAPSVVRRVHYCREDIALELELHQALGELFKVDVPREHVP